MRSEQGYLAYLKETLPQSDLLDYDTDFLMAFIREGMGVREEFPWCAALPEELFLPFVLYPRVFDEELSICREIFRRQLTPRVSGLSLEEAILEVNRWCAEHVTYRSTDDYTDSALRVYSQGYGRCGEESVFTVNAMRSVGIAARQVYAPWWSHCDDNHAWVEAWDGVRWRYLGACEPEPVLDRGWFTSAASRAMMIHYHEFFPGEEAPAALPVTNRYNGGREAPLTVFVADRYGVPVAGASVLFQVLNMGDFLTIADRKTGQDGKADCTLGFGSIWAVAEKDGLFAQALTVVSPEKKGQQVSLVLGEGAGSGEPEDFDFIAPDERCALCAIPLTAEQKRSRREVLDRCAALRAEWLAAAGEREAPPPRKALPLPFCGRESVPLTGGCSLTLTAPKVQNALWRQNYSLSKLDRGRFQVVRLKDIPAGGEEILSLPEGRYRLITTVRLPKGDQLARRWEFSLGPGKSRRIQLSFRQPALEDLLSSFSLPNFSLWDRSGGEIKSAALFQKTAYSLLCWLEPGREPTEHILNELREAGHGLAGCEINLVMEDWAGVGDFTCKRMLERFPKTEVWQGDFSDTAPALARSVFADPEKLPLILLVDRQGNCLYASSGYNVGTAELLVRLLHVLENT